MKRFSLILLIALCFGGALHSQNPDYKSGITFKKMFIDFQTPNGGEFTKFNDYRHGFEIGYQRQLGNKAALAIPARYGVIDSHPDSVNCLKKRIYSLDAQFQYHFTEAGKRIIPYVVAGVGGLYDDSNIDLQIPAGLGFYVKVAPKAFIHFQSEYRYSFEDKKSNLQHGLGFTYLFGKTKEEPPKQEIKLLDSDNDGIPDELDLCPHDFGSKDLNGCPDKDGDGIADYMDKCPDTKGLKEFGGCPDTDGDGIPDNEDECPNVSGVVSNKGCPEKIEAPKFIDSDGDGVEDSKDKCPNEKGSVEAMGCPDRDGDGVPDKDDKCPDQPGLKVYFGCPDTDGDGIDDSRDKCPNVPGTVANDGCPEIKKEDKKTLEIAMQAVQFQVGSAVLKPESSIVLIQIVDIMQRYTDFIMTISGHTDNTGSATANQVLSEKRARACYDFLIKNGVPESRVSYSGFGESRPISTNINEKGRSLNRRVEFNLIPRQ
ncbi:MAG: OmpA family protein [Saprospiraceae bacterium]|jgi:outer membrane protein OmpA-like peptidoglycan-associated protein|nr:OmpA family protein [Saprospiraceae bacterium]